MAVQALPIYLARDTAANWTSNNPTLLEGEFGYETNTGLLKCGDGTTAWTSLSYINVPSVTSMPASPATNTRVWRSDLELEFFYDGTRWLTTTLFHGTIPHPTNNTAFTVDGAVGWLPVPFRGTYGLWLDSWDACTYKGAAGTWNLELRYQDISATVTVIDTIVFTQSAAYDTQRVALGSVLSTSAYAFYVFIDEISGSSDCYPGAIINYRLIGT